MRNYIIYNGIASDEFDLYIGGQASFNAPKRKLTKVKIPGRNGDVIVGQQKSYENINVAYNIVGMDGFRDKTRLIKEWLMSPVTYCKLEDTYDPTTYRLGIITSDISFTMKRLNETGRAKIVFDCKPQKFLISGEIPQKIYPSDSIYNPTEFEAKPLIRVEGHGVLEINGKTITISGANPVTIIDSDIMDCYTPSIENANDTVFFQDNEFPVFVPEENSIEYDSGITRVVLAPRWWTL